MSRNELIVKCKRAGIHALYSLGKVYYPVTHRMFSSFLNALSKPPPERTPVEVEDALSQVVQEMQSVHLLDQDDYNFPGAFFSGPSPVCLDLDP